MPVIPEIVRFHFARLAPSPWNWYTKPDFSGCALRWTPPADNVALYIVFRSSENLPSDCCEDLLNGQFDDVVERIDIFKPISQLVDDEIHEKNRYLVLARLDNEDVVWVQDVESFQFSGAEPGETWTYWSNPYGDSPRIKDPCRLDYATVRVGTFCGFEWDYPSQYPEFVGYDLIVTDMPYSPHTGAESDIQAFREVLSGARGTLYSLERFVNAIVDNESFVNRFWYYVLLVRLPDSGRIQIPIRHVSEPFDSGKPFQYLSTRSGWGVGRDRMMAAYARWKATCSSGMGSSASISVVADPVESGEEGGKEGLKLEFFSHAPGLSLDSFMANPEMVGIQFSAVVPQGAKIVALRSRNELSPQICAEAFQKTIGQGVVETENWDGFAFVPNDGYMVLVDADCHDKSNYAFALCQEGDRAGKPLQHVKDVTVDYITKPETTIRWGNSSLQFENRLAHFVQVESFQKKNNLAMGLRVLDESGVTRIELYRFDRLPRWNAETVQAFHDFQRDGESSLGSRFVLDGVCGGVIDDVSSCHTTVYYAALSVDRHGNRCPIQIYSQGGRGHEDWPLLSAVSGLDQSPVFDEEDRPDEDLTAPRASVLDESEAPVPASRRRRYSWDDEESLSETPGLDKIRKSHTSDELDASNKQDVEAERQAREEAERQAREDRDIIKLLTTCRHYMDDGDMQEAYEVIQRALKRYPRNLRLEAFAWNYLR